MTLQSTMTAMCASLHAVMNFAQTDPPALYRVTSFDGVNRRRWTSQVPQQLRWLGTTPPARIRLSWYEHPTLPVSSDPLQEVTGDVINCGLGETYLAALWFRMVNVDLRFFNNHNIAAVHWVHVMHLGTNADSVGFYVASFPP